MPRLLNECEESSEPLLITTNKGEDNQQRMVIVSQEQYTMMINQINGVK